MLDPVELFPEVPNLYEFMSVHADMIFDERRVAAFRRAIQRAVRPGDIVVDVGTGTGLLAFLALQAGASHVHAIDRSPVIDLARELAQANGFTDRITFHHGDSRDTCLPEAADVIVSELIGHLAFEEGMAETLFDARARFLKPEGKIIPAMVALCAAPACEKYVYDRYINAWTSKWGIDYSLVRDRAARNCYIVELSEADLMAQAQTLITVDLQAPELPSRDFDVEYVAHRSGQVNGIAFWFDAWLFAEERLSSGPWSKTHWFQCFAPLATPIGLREGQRLQVRTSMTVGSRQRGPFMLSVTAIEVS